MTAKLALISTVLAASALALGCGLVGLWVGAAFLAALGVLCLVGQRRGWDWMASVGLIFFVGAATFGLWLGLAAGWMLFSVVAALSAWDLAHFAQRMKGAGRVERARELERIHFRRLLIVDGLGAAVAAVALGGKVEFGSGVAFLLGLVAVLGLSRVIGFLRRESD